MSERLIGNAAVVSESLKTKASKVFDGIGLFAATIIDAAVDDAHDRRVNRPSLLDIIAARAMGSTRPTMSTLRAQGGDDYHTSDAELAWDLAKVDGPAWDKETKGAFGRLVRSPRTIAKLGGKAVNSVGTKVTGFLNELEAATAVDQVSYILPEPPVNDRPSLPDRELSKLHQQVDAEAVDQSIAGL